MTIFCILNSQKNGRIYNIGGRFIEIHQNVLTKLTEWNTGDHRNAPEFDYPFGLALFLSIVPVSRILAGENLEDAMKFVRGNCFF